MPNSTIQKAVVQKAKMTNILFWVFIVIFVVTACLAFSVLVYVIFLEPEKAEEYPFIENFAWVLWSAVLAQVALGVFALYRNLFGLSAVGEVSDLSNTLTEVIDGLESNGIIPEDIAVNLREQYSDRLGTSGGTMS